MLGCCSINNKPKHTATATETLARYSHLHQDFCSRVIVHTDSSKQRTQKSVPFKLALAQAPKKVVHVTELELWKIINLYVVLLLLSLSWPSTTEQHPHAYNDHIQQQQHQSSPIIPFILFILPPRGRLFARSRFSQNKHIISPPSASNWLMTSFKNKSKIQQLTNNSNLQHDQTTTTTTARTRAAVIEL